MISSARGQAWRSADVCGSVPVYGRNVGRAFSPAAWGLRHHRVCGTMQASSPTDAGQGPAGVCGIPVGQGPTAGVNARPTMQGKQAAEPGGGRPPHTSVRSQRLRRGRCLHRPLPCRGLRDTCGARPPAGVNARPTMQGKQAAEPGGAAGRRMPPSARNACVGADACIGPPTGLAGAASSALSPVPGRNVGRAFSPAAWGSAASQGLQALPGFAGYLWGKAPGGRERPPYNAR